MSIKAFFEKHPIFRYEEFVDFMRKQGIEKSASCRQALNYHHKTGQLIHVRKNLYAAKPISTDEKNFWVDPYLIAGKSTKDAILAYHTALELHNIAYTTFERLNYLSQLSNKPFTYQGQYFQPVKPPKILVDKQVENIETVVMSRQNVKIKTTTLERTIVDCLARPDLAGGWEEIWRSLDHVTTIDTDKMLNYTLLLNNATIVAKVGFFLEQRPTYLSTDKKIIEQLLKHIPKRPHYMDRSHRKNGQHIKKWQLVVPLEIIERQWEEPNAIDA